MTTEEYGVRWIEFNKRDEAVMKEKFFKTAKAMDKFIEKVQQKDNFYEIYSYCYPKEK
jgi:desulfoferrodoxin (superoxide reductase-like protein)